MNRLPRAPALALVAFLTAGCPLPQPVPDYNAGTITPPRIVMDDGDSTSQIAFPETVVLVPPELCTSTAPSYPLAATLIDVDTFETVTARWFVNYDPLDAALNAPRQEDEIPGTSSDPPQTRRKVPMYTFFPWDSFGTVAGTGGGSGKSEGAVQIVELVVSNGFDPSGAPPGSEATRPFRSPALGFETQMFRWVFVTSAAACP